MVALQQDLIASTHAHHAMAEFVKAGTAVACPEKQQKSQRQSRRLQRPLHARMHCGNQSPAPTGAACTRAGTGTRIGAAFGTNPMIVPNIMITSPAQIQGTRGFR